MNLVEFYTKTVESLGFTVVDGLIMVGDNLVTGNDKLPYAIPSKEMLNTILTPDGKPSKIIFNPLMEDNFNKKATNVSLQKSILMGKMTLSLSILHIGKLLMGTIESTSSNFKLNEFYSKIAEITRNKAIKKVVDPKTVSVWIEVCLAAIESKELPLIKITQAKRGVVDKNTYNMVTSIYSPLLDHIINKEADGEKVTELFGVELRVKDAGLIKGIISFLLSGLNDNKLNTLAFGSNSDYAGFESFLTLYLLLAEHLNEITESLKGTDLDDYKEAKINLLINADNLVDLPDFRKLAYAVPTEKSIAPATTSITDRLNKIKSAQLNAGNTYNPYGQPQPEMGSAINTQNTNVPTVNNMASLLSKINGTAPIQQNNYQNNYQGERQDLHISNIYNKAQVYNPMQHQQPELNNTGMIDSGYVPASERQNNYNHGFGNQYNRGNNFQNNYQNNYVDNGYGGIR